ncbi:MAG: hypothetical protein J5821_02115 [Alphaproteobacteria bacterium]|nr:hypothetical protein [Alphaproteobacteria bacterium]
MKIFESRTVFNRLKGLVFTNNKTVLSFFGTLIFLGCTNTQAMGLSGIEKNMERSFDLKMPLSQWPIINSLVTQRELDCYRSTWNATKTLEENKKELVNQFMETCCDFSFKRKKEELYGITVGRTDNGEDIIFPEKGTSICARPNSTEVLIYNEKDRSFGLKAHVNTNIFLNVNPLDFTQHMRNKFEKNLSELTEDPVGCEVLRVAISKYKGSIRGLPKITFIPVKNKEIGLAYTTNSNVWKYMRKTRGIRSNKYRKLCKDRKFIMFSPNWFNSEQSTLFLKMNNPANDEGEFDFSLISGVIPKEVSLIHQIIYALNIGENNECRETQVIEERTVPRYFHANLKGIGNCIISGKQINYSLFIDDKVYRTMYGFTKEGLDLINESSYLAHRYGLIRPTYLGSDTQLSINGKVLHKTESYRFLDAFLQINGDHDLFRYYLSPKSSIEYPEFGIGRYACSDIRFVVGNNQI